jgi:hypothetical protein
MASRIGSYIANYSFELTKLIPFFYFFEILNMTVSVKFSRTEELFLTPKTNPSFTKNGSFFPFPRLWNNFFAVSFVAVSIKEYGIRLAFNMVSTREVALMRWEEPDVREVNK